jgi:hypothetical protein
MADPQPTLVELLVRHVLLPRERLPQIGINSIILPGASSDEFFRHIARLLRHGEPDMAALDRLGEQFDTLFVGPPLGHGA